MLSQKQGEFLVMLARKSAEDFVKCRKIRNVFSEPWLSGKYGLFVTIRTHPKQSLRGCIGFPMPHLGIGQAVAEASKSASCDPRFEKLKESELDEITFEVSVLSKPEEVKFKSSPDLIRKIKKGKDGLILEFGHCSGLFLPQVWDQLPGKEEFLNNLCIKAGLPAGTWKMPGARISAFRAQIFAEDSPKGKIKEAEE